MYTKKGISMSNDKDLNTQTTVTRMKYNSSGQIYFWRPQQ